MSRRKQLKPQALRKDEEEGTINADPIHIAANRENELKDASDMSSIVSDLSEEIGESEIMEPGDDQISCHFACSFCPATFDVASLLKQHEQQHADLMPYRCSLCGKGFKHKRSQDRHQKLHSGIRKYKCTLCQTAFFRSDHLKLHMKTHETAKYPFGCIVCKRGFNSSATLESHMQIHDGNKSVEPQTGQFYEHQTTEESSICTICNLQLSSAEDLLRHLDRDHQALNIGYESRSRPPSTINTLACPFCQKNDFQSEESFQLHLEVMHDTAPLIVAQSVPPPTTPKDRITCGLCPETFADINFLQKHTLKKHSLKDLSQNFDPTYSCDECGRIFDSILSLHSHTNSAHPSSASDVIRRSLHPQNQKCPSESSSSQIYQCSQCDTGLQNLKAFTSHMRQHLDLKQHEQHCDFCGLAFHSESTRDAHLVTHYLHKESQYSCKTCSKTFSVPEELQKHLMDIHAIHLYRCSLCKDIFESRVDVQVHFAVAHSNEVIRYRCRSCNAAFPSEDQFNVHLQVVHLQRPLASLQMFFCSICNKSFANESEHNSIHSAAFSCPICGESFAVEYLYDKHIESVHRNQMDYFGINDFSPKHNLVAPSSAPLIRVAGHSSTTFASTTPTIIKCNICDEKCDTALDLARHKLQHCKVIHSEICNFCQEPLGSVEQFYSHTRQHTVHGIPTSCVICKQSLVSLVEMQAHAKFHLKLSNVPSRTLCDQCGTYCDSKCAAKTECSPSISENLKCSQCQVKFEDDDELKKHAKENHTPTATSSQRSYQCIKCQKSFVTEAEIRTHVASHVLQDGINHHCSLCKKVFDSPSKLQRHLIDHSFIGCVEYECYLCNMIFASAEPLQQHMLTKHNLEDRPYECRLCEQKFFFRAELENHSFTHHNNSEEMTLSSLIADGRPPPTDLFACHHCGLVFNSANTLNSHRAQCRRKLTTASEEFHSSTNISSGSSQSSMKPADGCDKKLLVSGMASHPCPHCPKIFHSISALQGHSHVHMNSKIHQCIKCKKVFLTAAKLRNHQRQHNGDKPFPCEFCGRFFSRKDNLKVHMKIHFKNGSASPGDMSVNMEPPTMVTSPSFNRKQELALNDYNFEVSSNGSNNSTPNNLQESLSGFTYNLRSHCSTVNDDDSSED